MQVCPKEGNSPTILFWDHQLYLIERGLDSLGLIGIVILEFGIGKDFTWKKKGVKNSNNCCWWFRNPAPVEVGIVFPFIYNWLVVSKILYFHPYLGKIPILTNIFQMGWNHQPDKVSQTYEVVNLQEFWTINSTTLTQFTTARWNNPSNALNQWCLG